MVFTWDSVGVYSNNASTTNTFQLVLIDRADEGAGNFNVQFRYEDINWTTGSASGGVPAQAGYDAGDGMNFFTLPGSRTAAVANLDEIFSNTAIYFTDFIDWVWTSISLTNHRANASESTLAQPQLNKNSEYLITLPRDLIKQGDLALTEQKLGLSRCFAQGQNDNQRC